MIQECRSPIAVSDFKWISACDCEGTEQLRLNQNCREIQPE